MRALCSSQIAWILGATALTVLPSCARTFGGGTDAGGPDDARMDAGSGDTGAPSDGGMDGYDALRDGSLDAVQDEAGQFDDAGGGGDGTVVPPVDGSTPGCPLHVVEASRLSGFFQDSVPTAGGAWIMFKTLVFGFPPRGRLSVTRANPEGDLIGDLVTVSSSLIPPTEDPLYASMYSRWATGAWTGETGVVVWGQCGDATKGSQICNPLVDSFPENGWWELRARAFDGNLDAIGTSSSRIIATGSSFNSLSMAWEGTAAWLATLPLGYDDDEPPLFWPPLPDYDAALFLLNANGEPLDLTFEDHTGVMSAQPIEMQPRPDRVLLEAEDDGTVHALYRTVPDAPDGGVPERRVLHLGTLGLDGTLDGVVLDEGAHLVDASGYHGLDLGAIGRLTLLPDGRRAVAWVGEFDIEGPAEQSTLAIVEADGSSALRRVLPSVTSILWHDGQLLVTTFDGTSSELLVLDPATLDTVTAYPAPGKARHLVGVEGGFLVISQVSSSVVISRLECVEPPDAGP
jgi:hypothetical protein